MKLVFLDSTAVVATGPGSPAFFSRFAIAHLRAQKHDVTILDGFYPDECRRADVVVCEWANEEAYEAAASGLCKRLVIHLRGFDAFGPLDRMEWGNVDALVYESPFLKQFVEERFPGLRDFRTHVIPSGVDVENIPFRERAHGPVVAMVGRGVADKGYQLAFEWARQRPDIELHAALALPEPRLLRYLAYTKPNNVTIYGQVDTVEWLDRINANYLLSASNWESLGYTIAEAMAMGVSPLVHDTPGSNLNWPIRTWTSFEDLNLRMLGRELGAYPSRHYRAFVEEHLDAAKQSAKFADLVLAPSTRASITPNQYVSRLLTAANTALVSSDILSAERAVTAFRALPPDPSLVDHRTGLALALAARAYAADQLAEARVWALRAMADEAYPDAMCLLGEIALATDDLEDAERWYTAACVVEPIPSHYSSELMAGRHDRLAEIQRLLCPLLEHTDAPSRYLIVVPVRNAEKYIERCLESVKALRHALWMGVAIDDASFDGTGDAIIRAVVTSPQPFAVQRNKIRAYSLYNSVHAIREHGRPGDVVLVLDGDDELIFDALTYLDAAYRRGAWMTYGNFATSAGKLSWMPPYPQKVLRGGTVREYPWRASAPRSFKIELFNKIPESAFLDRNGEWFKKAGDVALILPMLEMAAERAVYVPQQIYVYNEDNPECDHRVDSDEQVRVRDEIREKPKFNRLEKLGP